MAEVLPGVFISLSSEISPNVGEYARMSTTAANAALGPLHIAPDAIILGAARGDIGRQWHMPNRRNRAIEFSPRSRKTKDTFATLAALDEMSR